MPTITENNTKTTKTTTIEMTATELFSFLRAGFEASGGTWPDFGADEGDQAVLKVVNAAGSPIWVDNNNTNKHTLTVTDRETVNHV